MSLEGRTAIVTGVSSGLGVGIARVFCAAGVKVVGIARRAERCEELKAEIADRGGSFSYVQGDVSKASDCSKVVNLCLDQFGRVDILINNAAIAGVPPLAAIEDIAEETIDRVLAINIKGAIFMCQRVLPAMQEQRDGVILNISSLNGIFGTAKFAVYNASKAALIHFTHTLATEGASFNIRANSILLGSVKSDMNDATNLAVAQSAARTTEMPTAAQREAINDEGFKPDEVGETLTVLCGPAARLITGADIPIDRGMSAGVMATYALNQSMKRMYKKR